MADGRKEVVVPSYSSVLPPGSLNGHSRLTHAGLSKPGSGTVRFVPEVGASPLPGYQLVRLRGKGGFATVWEATSPTGERVALKFMSSANAASTARELRSLQTIQGIHHPHLLKMRNVWSVAGNIVIAMDLAEASLLDLLQVYLDELGKPPELEKIGLYLYQAAVALDYLNGRRHRLDGRTVALQHGDVKPNNILLLGETALLADYGLATPLTTTLTPCPRQGTVEYCAPEVFQGQLSDKSDQFSFAVSYCVLRTLAFPYPAPPEDREQLRGYVRPEPDLSAHPPAERPLLARALSPIPQMRHPSCLDLIVGLLNANGLRVDRDNAGRLSVGPVPSSASPSGKSSLRFVTTPTP
jgi:serine/threonine protein kinase